MNRVAFATLGCKTNQYETDALMDVFYQNRYTVVDFDEMSDIYIINTCTVTHVGDKKSRQLIRRAKKSNPKGIVVVMGCYAQISPNEVEKIEGVDIIIGTDSRQHVLSYIDQFRKQEVKKTLVIVDDIMKIKTFEEMPLGHTSTHTRAFIKIQEGCNQYCTYCIIPYARGQVRSRDMASVIKEVSKLIQSGYKEFVLTGIHIGSYGLDLENVSLITLLEALDSLEGIERIRLGSIEPRLITDDFVKRLSGLKSVCDHFHVSMQSGSDTVLKRMNRKYTSEEYLKAVNRIRMHYKNPSITTDVIVGFPGETDEEFEETLAFVEGIAFSELHVFPFSQREGTPAATMPNQIQPEVKKKRSDLLIQLGKRMQEAYLDSFVGTTVDIIIEEKTTHESKGHSRNYLMVRVPTEAFSIGDLVHTSIVKREGHQLIGAIK